MATKRKPQVKPINIGELPQQRAAEYVSTYSNHIEIGNTPFDFQFLFFDVTEDETGKLIREKKARVLMSPQHALVFSQVLNSTITKWMEEHASEAVGSREKEQ